jgi:hypothetical protein
MSDSTHEDGIFVTGLKRYRTAVFPLKLSRVIALGILPNTLCGIVAEYDAPSAEQFAALALEPPTVLRWGAQGLDIIQHGLNPAIVYCAGPFNRHSITIKLSDLYQLDKLAARHAQVVGLSVEDLAESLGRALFDRLNTFNNAYKNAALK